MREVILEMGLHHWRLQSDRLYVIGNDATDPESQLFINLKQDGVAARHALLKVRENGCVALVDLLSATGTYLNETRLEPLSEKDIGEKQTTAKLRFGSVEIKYKTICEEESLDSSGFHDGPKNADKSNSSIIPETQMIEGDNVTANDNNDTKDDSCIPETQMLLPPSYINGRRERLLAHSTLSSKTANNADDDIFRIGTQEFNENFFNDSDDDGENDMSSLIIPLVKHSTIILQEDKNQKCTDAASADDVDAELCEINSSNNNDAMSDRLLNTCTPDLFDIPDLTHESEKKEIKVIGDKQNHSPAQPPDQCVIRIDTVQNASDDDELQPTQIFPVSNSTTIKKPATSEEFSQKENMLPHRTRSPKPSKVVDVNPNSTSGVTEKKSSDDISLATTQIFSLQTLRSNRSATERQCFHSSSLISDSKKKVSKSKHSLAKNATEPGSSTSSDFMSNRDLGLAEGPPSVCSDFDISCTPQLIKDLFDSKNSEVTPLNTATKLQKKQQLFGADSDDDLVDILTAPKISHDFDALLPHLQQHRSSGALEIKGEERNNEHTHTKGRSNVTKRGLTTKYAEEIPGTKQPVTIGNRESPKPKSSSSPLNISKESKKKKSTTRNSNVYVETNSTKNIDTQAKGDVNRFTRSKSCVKDTNNDAPNDNNKMNMQAARRTTRSKSIAVSKEEMKNYTHDSVDQERVVTRVTRSRSQSGIQSTDNLPQQKQAPQLKRRIASTTDAQSKRSRVSTSNTSSSSDTKSNSVKLKVCTTMVNPEVLKPYEEQQSDVYEFVKDPVDSNLLVMDKGNRTFKFLIAMARGIPIVTSNWLQFAQHDIPHIAQYIFTDTHFERRHHFKMLNSLQLAKKQKIFDGYDFLCTTNVQPQPSDLSAIVQCAGGTMCNIVPKLQGNRRLFLISSIEDKKHWHKYRRLNSDISIISTEAIMSSVMRQSVKPLDSYRLA